MTICTDFLLDLKDLNQYIRLEINQLSEIHIFFGCGVTCNRCTEQTISKQEGGVGSPVSI